MNAQEIWLSWYRKWYNAIHRHLTEKAIRSRRIEMYRIRREAALERIIARQQREIDKHSNALLGMSKAWRDYANCHYCQTYNIGMAQGLICAADALEAYASGMEKSAHRNQP